MIGHWGALVTSIIKESLFFFFFHEREIKIQGIRYIM